MPKEPQICWWMGFGDTNLNFTQSLACCIKWAICCIEREFFGVCRFVIIEWSCMLNGSSIVDEHQAFLTSEKLLTLALWYGGVTAISEIWPEGWAYIVRRIDDISGCHHLFGDGYESSNPGNPWMNWSGRGVSGIFPQGLRGQECWWYKKYKGIKESVPIELFSANEWKVRGLMFSLWCGAIVIPSMLISPRIWRDRAEHARS